jgi:glycerol-3-phosphate dehydrogenase
MQSRGADPVSRSATIPAPQGRSTFLSAARRAAELERLADGEAVDVAVIGGGVTGVGVALDAASRGLTVALLERRDLAHGSSRWSSKLAHGGLRYLARGQFGVAWESARERDILATISAPHLVRALPQLTPLWGSVPTPAQALLALGIRLGDGMRAASGTSRRRLPPMRHVGAAEALLWAPALSERQLRGGVLAWDGQLEDDARLVVAIARTAAAMGARICTYCEVVAIETGGVRVREAHSGQEIFVRARHVVNATGVWAGTLVGNIALRPSRGSHLLVRGCALGEPRAMLNVPVPGHFGRFVFAVPRSDGLVMIGLTDEPAGEGPIPDEPEVSEPEESYLLQTISTALRAPLDPCQIVGRFAGLRPLLAGASGQTADLSRRHAVLRDAETGAITVVGGKLTTYRRMAEDAVDAVLAAEGRRVPCRTRSLQLVGAPPPGAPVTTATPARLWRRFGTEAAELASLAAGRPELLRELPGGVLGVELLAAVEREGALTLCDVLERRTRMGLVPEWRTAGAEAAAQLLDRVPAAVV